MCDCNVDDSEHNVCEYNDDEKNLSDLKMNNCNDEYQEYILGNNEQLDDKLRVLVNDIQNGKYKIKDVSFVDNKENECITITINEEQEILVHEAKYKKPCKTKYLEFLGPFKKNTDPNLNNELCPICLENYTTNNCMIRKLKCGHIFHKKCIDKWLYKSEKIECPYCNCKLKI